MMKQSTVVSQQSTGKYADRITADRSQESEFKINAPQRQSTERRENLKKKMPKVG